MKKILIAATLMAALSTGAQAGTVRLGTEGAYAPWNYMDDSGQVAGFEIALGNELCKRAALECEWVVNEWDTIIPNLVAGNYDAIMAGMSVTEERMKTIDFSQEYYPPDPSRYAVSVNSNIDFDNLTGVKIGVQGATIQADYAEANLSDGNTILSYETGDQSVADLLAGNVDIVLADGAFLGPIIDGSGNVIKFDGPSVAIGGGVGIGMRKADDEMEAKFNTAIDAMKADGSLNALLNEWFDNPPTF